MQAVMYQTSVALPPLPPQMADEGNLLPPQLQPTLLLITATLLVPSCLTVLAMPGYPYQNHPAKT
jgi:hypothetical protein